VTTILAFVFVLGVLIFVHELGHFVMARRIGVRVLTFSLGFGPKLLRIKRGDTEYCISAIPLGGYVKMAGENPRDGRSGAADEFLSKSKWQRFQVLIMGPVMNVVLALVVMAVVLYQAIPVPAYGKHPVVIGDFVGTSAARDGGLAVGDRIVAVGRETVEDWDDFLMAIATKANRQVTLRAERDGAIIERQVTPAAEGRYKIGDIGIVPVLNPQVARLTPGEPAEAAGLRKGDVVVAAGRERNPSSQRVIEMILASPDQPLILEVRRDGAIQQIAITPRRSGDTPIIGVLFGIELRESSPGPLEAIKLSAIQNWKWTVLLGKTIEGLLTRDMPMNQMMGPLGIAEVSGSAAKAGWAALFTIMALISLNLGLFNLLPIPVLDGGHIMILALEGVSRRDFSVQVKQKMVLVGMVLLLTLMGAVLFQDLARIEWIQRLMEGPG
jgi:regulator of sigma E protease